MSLSYQLQHCYQGQQAEMLCSVVQLRMITHSMQLLLAMQLNIDVTDRWDGINWEQLVGLHTTIAAWHKVRENMQICFSH